MSIPQFCELNKNTLIVDGLPYSSSLQIIEFLYNKLNFTNERVVIKRTSFIRHGKFQKIKYWITNNSNLILIDEDTIHVTRINKWLSPELINVLTNTLIDYTDEQLESIKDLDLPSINPLTVLLSIGCYILSEKKAHTIKNVML